MSTSLHQMNYFEKWISSRITPVGWVLIALGISGLVLALLGIGIGPGSTRAPVFSIAIAVGMLPIGSRRISGDRRARSTRRRHRRGTEITSLPRRPEQSSDAPAEAELWRHEVERSEATPS